MSDEQIRSLAIERLNIVKGSAECQRAVMQLLQVNHERELLSHPKLTFEKYGAHFLTANVDWLAGNYGNEVGRAARLLRPQFPVVRKCKIAFGQSNWG